MKKRGHDLELEVFLVAVAVGLRDEECLRLKILTCMLPEI
jgi:hypothetical protein